MGDGVNIAARLEGVAKPGAICLSEDAYRQVKGRLDLAVTDLGPTRAQEHRRADPGLFARSRPARPQAKPAPCVGARKIRPAASLDRRAAVRQYRRRPGAGAFRRRGHGEPDHRPLTNSRGRRDRPQYGVHLQRQAARRKDDRARVERPLRPRGQRSARRKPHARQRAAYRRRNGQSSLGRAVRQAPRRSFRHAGRNRRAPGRRAQRPARRRRGATSGKGADPRLDGPLFSRNGLAQQGSDP